MAKESYIVKVQFTGEYVVPITAKDGATALEEANHIRRWLKSKVSRAMAGDGNDYIRILSVDDSALVEKLDG